MSEHRIKTWPNWFRLLFAGKKTADVRINDRNFKEGDTVVFEEWEPNNEQYTGETIRCTISHVLRIDKIPYLGTTGWVMLSLAWNDGSWKAREGATL